MASIFNIGPNDKVAAFIDGANLYASCKSLGFEMDYKRLRNYLRDELGCTRIYFYTALVEGDNGVSPVKPLVDWLDYNGYTVRSKQAKEYADATGRRKIKGNMDVEIVVDMMRMSGELDHIILFSGDGDFRYALDAIRSGRSEVTVVSTYQTQPPMVADEMRRGIPFVDLVELEDHIANKGKPRLDNSEQRRPQESQQSSRAARYAPRDDEDVDTTARPATVRERLATTKHGTGVSRTLSPSKG